MADDQHREVELVPIDSISVVNPRARNRKVFKEIVDNIAALGLKKPITVTRRECPDGARYDLVCGQGRLEAYQALGQTEIPAFVIQADVESGMVMSLVENLARRQHRAIDLLHDIQGLNQRGYEPPEIAQKTGLTLEYVRGVLRLLAEKEDRLLRAVESGQLPVSVAVEIATTDDAGAQRILQQAYESKILRGNKLLAARRLLQQRRRRGKQLISVDRKRPISAQGLLRTYKENIEKKRLLVRKAESTRDRLVFVTEALRKILADENFTNLLGAEGLDSLPQNLTERLARQAGG